MTHPTDEELDAMVRELMSRPYRRGSESSDEAAMRRQNEREQAAAAITTLRAQLAEARAELENANKIMDDWTTLHRVIADIRDASGLGSRPMLSDLATEIGRSLATSNARADRAEAEISRLTDLNSTAYIDGHDAAKNEYRDEIQRLEALNAQPHDRTALQSAIRAAKVEAWREAADELKGQGYNAAVHQILALIEREGV